MLPTPGDEARALRDLCVRLEVPDCRCKVRMRRLCRTSGACDCRWEEVWAAGVPFGAAPALVRRLCDHCRGRCDCPRRAEPCRHVLAAARAFDAIGRAEWRALARALGLAAGAKGETTTALGTRVWAEALRVAHGVGGQESYDEPAAGGAGACALARQDRTEVYRGRRAAGLALFRPGDLAGEDDPGGRGDSGDLGTLSLSEDGEGGVRHARLANGACSTNEGLGGRVPK